jgi:hypothetical protein
MTTIVDSIRKHQKMIVLGAALAVISLYIIPLDQIVSAVSPPGLANAQQRIADIRAKIQANIHLSDENKQRIDSHLAGVQDRLSAIQYRLLGV